MILFVTFPQLSIFSGTLEWEAARSLLPLHGPGAKQPHKHQHDAAVQKTLLQSSEKVTAVPTGWVTGPLQDHHGGRQLHSSRWESPRPLEAKPVLPGSLVVDAEGVEDVQEGCEEGEELQERKKSKSFGSAGRVKPHLLFVLSTWGNLPAFKKR